MARSFNLKKVVNDYGLPLLGIKCEGINATTSAVAETQWTDTNGEAAFIALPDAGTVVHIKIYREPFVVEWRNDIFFETVPLSADHGSLSGLGDDDHTQYLKESEYTAADVVLIGAGVGTITPITLAASQFLAKKAAGAAVNVTATEARTILNVEDGATKYPDTGEQAFLDADHTKLDGIEAGADVTDATNVAAAGAVMVDGSTAYLATSELTISVGGAIVPTQNLHTVDTNADGATDDLDTITNTNTLSWVVIRAENDARTVIVKHNTGNIWLQGKADVSLDDLEDGLLLFWDTVNSKWFDISAGGGGGGLSSPLIANLDFAGYQAQNIVIHKVADEAARLALTVVTGKLAYQIDEGALYLYA